MKTFLFFFLFLALSSVYAQVLHEALESSFEELSSLGEVDIKCMESDLLDRSSIPIEEKHKYVDLGISSIETASYNGLELSVLSPKQAEQIFEHINQLEYIPKKYLEDGCYARAHEVFLIAKENGLSFGKAYVVSEIRGLLYPQKSEASFHKSFTGFRYYHTSAVALVRGQNGELSPVVFDIGLSKKAQKVDQWRQSLSSFEDRIDVVYREGDIIFHDSSMKAPQRSLLKNLKATEETIDELGYDEYLFRLRQGWL